MHLQLGLPVDGSIVTGFVQSADWGAICGELLGTAPETIYGGWIEMAWIRKNFTELVEDSIEVQRERYALAYILQIIGGILMSDESRNLVHLRWLLKLAILSSRRTQLGVRCVGDIVPRDVSGDATRKNQNWWLSFTTTIMGLIPISIVTSSSELLVYIFTRNKFEWTPYEDPIIREVIPDEFLVNPNVWHVKVPLVVYATVEMHETDRNWLVFHSPHINIWNNRYDFLPTRKPIIVPELACDPEYMLWFRIHGKPYLYGEEEKRQHPHTSRPRRSLLNLKASEYVPSYSSAYSNPIIFTQAPYVAPHFSASSPMP
ncbi:hypothetical protein Golax_012869, partial [Gossypium laxum]|nr:hypothetical protein [Gossypium laxum]